MNRRHKKIIRIIRTIQKFLKNNNEWSCVLTSDYIEPFTSMEIASRFLRMFKGYKTEISFGTHPTIRTCYIKVYKK